MATKDGYFGQRQNPKKWHKHDDLAQHDAHKKLTQVQQLHFSQVSQLGSHKYSRHNTLKQIELKTIIAM
jgi:hypothetical protein